MDGGFAKAKDGRMMLNPALSRSDRVANAAAGITLASVGILRNFDHSWVRIALVVVGITLVVGSVAGT